jgi:hypothetical protein
MGVIRWGNESRVPYLCRGHRSSLTKLSLVARRGRVNRLSRKGIEPGDRPANRQQHFGHQAEGHCNAGFDPKCNAVAGWSGWAHIFRKSFFFREDQPGLQWRNDLDTPAFRRCHLGIQSAEKSSRNVVSRNRPTFPEIVFDHMQVSAMPSQHPPREPLPRPRFVHPGRIRQWQFPSFRHRQPTL